MSQKDKVSLSLDHDVLIAVGRLAENEQRSRSQMFSILCREALQRRTGG